MMGLRNVIVGTNTFIGGVEIIFDSRLVRDSRSFIQLNDPEYTDAGGCKCEVEP